MLKFKEGVSILGASNQVSLGITCAHSVYLWFGEICTVTSVVDGKHGKHSHHKKGCAFDLRTRGVNVPENTLVEMLQDSLGDEWQVILEVDHIHVEYDPK
ncbi:hypothetical protein [Sulfurovum sp.]|uniref:hypothetical protein n=1 Tax=Sulfurovum sp. TaxID=1969726 RepID=UPI0035687249